MEDPQKSALLAIVPLASHLLNEQFINAALLQIVLLRLGVPQEIITAAHAQASGQGQRKCRELVRELIKDAAAKAEESGEDWWRRESDE